MSPNEIAEFLVLTFVLVLLILLLILVGYVCRKLWPGKEQNGSDQSRYDRQTRSDLAVVTLDTNSSIELVEAKQPFMAQCNIGSEGRKVYKDKKEPLIRSSNV